jgi:hypothetical protein
MIMAPAFLSLFSWTPFSPATHADPSLSSSSQHVGIVAQNKASTSQYTFVRDYDVPLVMMASAGLVGPVDFFDRRVSGKGYSSGSSSSLYTC